MKVTYKVSLIILSILLVIYLVLAQTQQSNKLITGRIEVSTNGAMASFTSGNNFINVGAMMITEFLPIPKGKCNILIITPIWAGFQGLSQAITISEAKNVTTSKNMQKCPAETGFGAIGCDAIVNLDDEYYLMRIDFANPVPYFAVNYQCKIQ